VSQHEIELIVGGWDDDPTEISDAGDRLREELDLLDFVRLDRPAIPSEHGTRSGAAVAAGTFLGLVASPVFLRAVVDVVKSWLERPKRGSVTIKIGDDSIELTAATRAQQDELVQAFLDRHAGS
jgi:Effector Associated Constant Component 1